MTSICAFFSKSYFCLLNIQNNKNPFFAYRNESGTFLHVIVKVVLFCIILFHLLGEAYLFFVVIFHKSF
jgi:hypothetical protein